MNDNQWDIVWKWTARFCNVRILVVLLFAWLLLLGCSPPTTTQLRTPDLIQIADALANAGDHLNASYYYEAAVDAHPQQESVLLRRLVAEQILSDRLLAAQSTIERLSIIESNDPTVAALQIALQQRTNNFTKIEMEVHP